MIQFGIVKYGIVKTNDSKDKYCYNKGGDELSSEDDEPLSPDSPMSSHGSTSATYHPDPSILHNSETSSDKQINDVENNNSTTNTSNIIKNNSSALPIINGDILLQKYQDISNNNDDKNINTEIIKTLKEKIMDNPLASNLVEAAGGMIPNHVTLEALENTKVAVAQFAATAMANGADETALKELAILQSTLFSLQHQQVLQMQLIQQLQSQLIPAPIVKTTTESIKCNQNNENENKEDIKKIEKNIIKENINDNKLIVAENENIKINAVVDNCSSVETPIIKREVTSPTPINESEKSENKSNEIKISQSITPTPSHSFSPSIVSQTNRIPSPMCHISSSLASSIITYHDTPSSLDEPNTLEMLQKRAQEVLDSASQGLLSGNLVDELTFRSEKMSPFDSKGGSRGEPFFKHRCRYCGKVFGSDSALQIHVRSHTGERPFKCNVCGSRFTTKGNLKVHFTRHTQKFPPHMPMNMIPIPAEHMEKYHSAALLGQMPIPSLNGTISQTTIPSPGGPFPSVSGFPGLPIYRPSQMDFFKSPTAMSMHHHHHHHHHHPHNQPTFFRNIVNTNEQDTPADLSLSTKQLSQKENDFNQLEQIDRISENNSNSITPEIDETFDIDSHQENASIQNSDTEEHFHHRSATPKNCINNENDVDDDVNDDDDDDDENNNEDAEKIDANNNTENNEVNIVNEIANDENQNNMVDGSSKSTNIECNIDVAKPLNLSEIRCRSHTSSTSTIPSELMVNEYHQRDPTKNPAVYSTMLPRPGSNDSSWENLIEITKTSETSKLQEFVDNIENKLTDPNQCFMCHRVLSCRSSLQMHYRTHTGERPFRCRICGRAFTTKGNLKTHMGVHRIKPAMRNLHQCPVCHKKYTNALVLQQHIKTHTGEPTDLTFDQIRAAEIRDFIPLPPGYFQSIGLNQYGGIEKSNEDDDSNESESSIDDNEEFLEEKEEADDDDDNDDDFNNAINTNNFNDNDSVEELNHNRDENLSASHRIPLENQVQTITAMASQMSATADINKLNSDNKMEFDKTKSLLNGNLYPPITENKLTPKQNIPQFLNVLDLTPNSHENNSISIPKQHINLYPNIPFLPHIPHLQTTSGPMDEVKQSLSLSKLSPSPTKSTESSPKLFTVEQRQQQQQQINQPPILQNNTLNSLAHSILPTGPFNPFGLTGIRGNTTCNICFKTFACHSALEIHYRSHTKERPFKCTVCDRGFSTKGNMKQHMLTHKIRDMPQHMFGNSVQSSPSSDSDHSFVSHHSRENQLLQHPQHQQQQSHQHSQQIRSGSPVYYDNRISKNLENGTTIDELHFKETELLSSHLMEPHNKLEFGIKRSPPPSLEFDHSLPKRPLILSPLNPSNRSSNIKASIDDGKNNNNEHDDGDDHDNDGDNDDDDDDANDDNINYDKQSNNKTTFLSSINLLDQRMHVTESTNFFQPQQNQQQQSEISLSSSPVSHYSSSPNDNDDTVKHLCSVCHKSFSSTSALQIHLRTHTGDKPFRCSICEKSFTTKGNLKVHMGIHMWSTTGFSRRGRRMSLELPLKHPLPLSQKDSEFLQQRPDLFYPYHHHHLPTPYPNGIHSKFNGLSGISTDSNIHSIGMLRLPNINAQYPSPLYPQIPSHPQNTSLVPISKNYLLSSQSMPINNIDKNFHSPSSPTSFTTRTIPIESNIKSIRIPNIREQQRQQQKQDDELQSKPTSETNINNNNNSVHKSWMDLNYSNKINLNSNNNCPSAEIIINKENLSTIKNISRIPAIVKTSTHQQQESVTVT